jgi:hypothetical protein
MRYMPCALGLVAILQLGCPSANDAGTRPEHAKPAQESPAPTTPQRQDPRPTAVAGLGEPCNETVRCGPELGCSGLYFDAEGTCIPEDDAAARCDDAGGDWGRWGLAGLTYCMRILPDAGHPCTRSDECRGACILDKDGQGRCQRHETQFGCYTVLDDGPVGQTLCVD